MVGQVVLYGDGAHDLDLLPDTPPGCTTPSEKRSRALICADECLRQAFADLYSSLHSFGLVFMPFTLSYRQHPSLVVHLLLWRFHKSSNTHCSRSLILHIFISCIVLRLFSCLESPLFPCHGSTTTDGNRRRGTTTKQQLRPRIRQSFSQTRRLERQAQVTR